jgi:salicylate hydroxylase
MTPHQGSGAGQAVEVRILICIQFIDTDTRPPQDAFILATVLGHPNTVKGNIPYALSVYDRIRRPYALNVQERSRLNGLYFTLQPPEFDFIKLPEHELLPKLKTLGRLIYSNWDWAWTSSMGSAVQEAVQLLDTSS